MTETRPKTWEQTGREKARAVRTMFGELAPQYDRINGLMSLSLHHKWRTRAVKSLKLRRGDRVLDLCCGTGDFFAPLREAIGPDGTIVGIDFSGPMLDQAALKRVPGKLILGDASHLSMASEEFDAVSVGWGIRNVPDIDATHREAFRVLKPGGRFVSLDTAMPRNFLIRWVSRIVLGVVPALGSLFGHGAHYTYLKESTAKFWSRQKLGESMRQAGFEEVGWSDLMFGNLCMHWGRKPMNAPALDLVGGENAPEVTL